MNKLDPLNDGISSVAITNKHVDPLLSVVNAARVSYNNQKEETDERDQKLSKFLWDHGHTSPYRHQFYTINIKAPLFVFRQWWKHQVGAPWIQVEGQDEEVALDLSAIQIDTDNSPSWNEVSGRYVKLEPEFFIPKKFRSNAGHANKQASSTIDSWDIHDHMTAEHLFRFSTKQSYDRYQEALSNGIAREQARMLLPQNIYSSCVWTPSLQALIHFLSLRCKEDAQEEIRAYALAIKDLIHEDLDQLNIEL